MPSRTEGFTLIELIVVVLLLGVLVAVTVPRVIVKPSCGCDSAVSQTLCKIRDAMESYRVRTESGYPQGTSSQIQAKLQGYLPGHGFPRVNIGGINNNSEILIDTDQTPTVDNAGGQGWVYSPSSGEIRINSNAELVSQPGSGIKYSDL